MELIRRDSDYALRLAASLTREYVSGKALSARTMAKNNGVSYTLACKLLQKLAQAGLIESTMGPKGGFRLAKEPRTITFADIVGVVQGPVCVNKCSDGSYKCPMKCACGMRPKLMELQNQIHQFLYALNLSEFLSKENENGK